MESASSKIVQKKVTFQENPQEVQYIYFGKTKLTMSTKPKVRKVNEFELWTKIQNAVGNATTWPAKCRQLFWTRNLDYWDRLMLAVFVHINSLDLYLLLKWAKLKGLFLNRKAQSQTLRILQSFNAGALPKLYGFNVRNCQFEWVNGGPRF